MKIFIKNISEEAVAGGGTPPTNNVGSGNLAGMGVAGAANQEPGVSVKAQKKRYAKSKSPILFPQMIKRTMPNNISEDMDTFAGAVVFEMSPSLFYELKVAKRKGQHWKTYLGENDCLHEIREYANKNPKKPIVVKNSLTSEMMYVRYGKKRGL